MKKWYCVTTTFDDRGNVTANITDTKESAERPKNEVYETTTEDVYMNWFATEKEAIKYCEQAKFA